MPGSPAKSLTSTVAGPTGICGTSGSRRCGATGQARHGAMRALFGGIRAPSTLGSFLRGNVLGKVHRLLLADSAAFYSAVHLGRLGRPGRSSPSPCR